MERANPSGRPGRSRASDRSSPRTAAVSDTFAEAGLVVRPYVSGQPGDGVRITVGEPEANARVLEVAARLAGTVGGPA